jgi:hypothetical protein
MVPAEEVVRMTLARELILLVLYTGLAYTVWGFIRALRDGRKPPYDKW